MYINRQGQGFTETVDQSDTNQSNWDFRKLLQEYITSDPSSHYYISQRACKGWDK